MLLYKDTVYDLTFKTSITKGFQYDCFFSHFNMTTSSCLKFIMLGRLYFYSYRLNEAREIVIIVAHIHGYDVSRLPVRNK
jgi:hypothetical protein